jgi:hypothetical protein
VSTFGPDPLPGPPTTRDTWESVKPSYRMPWIGSNRTLFWDRDTGEYSVYEYRWTGVPVDADPYKDEPTSKGTWNDADRKGGLPKRGVVGGELLYLGNQLLLHWVPTGPKTSSYALWRVQPGHPTDPLTTLVTQGTWGSIGNETRLVYLGADMVLAWDPAGEGDARKRSAFYNVWKVNRAVKPGEDPLPGFVANGKFDTVGADHELFYLGRERLLVWEPRRKLHAEEPDRKETSRYRVFRVDRAAKAFSGLLPERSLAEGLWYTIFQDAASNEHHTLTPIGDAELRMIDLVRSSAAAERKVRIWPVKSDIPEATGVPGATIRREGTKVRLTFVPNQLVAALTGQPINGSVGPTFEELADQLALSPLRVFADVTGFPANGKTVEALYKEHFEDKPYPGFAQAGRRLTTLGRGAVASQRYGYISQNQFRAWVVHPTFPLTVTISDDLTTKLMADAAARQRAAVDLKVVQPHFDVLKGLLEKLELANARLNVRSDGYAIALESAHQDLSTLNALAGLLALMRSRAKGDSASKADLQKVADLEKLVETLTVEHVKHTIVDPKHRQDARRERDAAADEVLKLLEDPALLPPLQVYVDNAHLARTSLETLVFDTLRNAYELLLVSQHAAHIIDAHVQPAIMIAASRQPLADVKTGLLEFDAALVEPIAAPKQPSALATVASRSSPVGTAVGNTPGPPSLAVIIFHLAAPQLAQRLGAAKDVSRFGAFCFRALAWSANFNAIERMAARSVISEGNLSLTRKIDFQEKFQTGPAATAAVGLLSAIALWAAITDDEATTRKKVFNIMSSAAGLGSASLQMAQAFCQAMNVGRLGTIVGITGRSLGTLAGFVAAGLGAAAALESKEKGDDLGFWLSAVGAGAAYATAAGFIVAGGITGMTGIGAGPGAVLMVIGIVVGLGAGVIQVWRDVTTNATHSVVEALVTQYSRGEGAYSPASTKPGAEALKAAFEAVHKAHFPGVTGFMPLVAPGERAGDEGTNFDRPDLKDGGTELLYDLGFSADAIKLIVDDDSPGGVTDRLKARRGWPRPKDVKLLQAQAQKK